MSGKEKIKKVYAMRIDSHQHFWTYVPSEYGWMKPDWPIRRDYLPEDLLREFEPCNLDGCVAVQARQTLEESRWLLELADHHPMIKGVVGWVDLRADNVAEQLELFAHHPRFVGVRHIVQDEPDNDFMLGNDFQRGISHLAPLNLVYDILVFPYQLPASNKLVRRFPNQLFVLDHIAKPFIKDGMISDWKDQIRELAKAPNVFCKISGMITEASWHTWKPEDFRPYLDIVVEAFGIDRLMYGSDWPVALLAGTYRQVYDLAHDYVSSLGADAERAIFGETAARFYLNRRQT